MTSDRKDISPLSQKSPHFRSEEDSRPSANFTESVEKQREHSGKVKESILEASPVEMPYGLGNILENEAGEEQNSESLIEDSCFESKVPQGITNEMAIDKILEEISKMVVQRNKYFNDHTNKYHQKFTVSMKYLLKPNMILTVIFMAVDFYNIDWKAIGEKDHSLQKSSIWNLIVFVCILLMLTFDLYLQIKKVDYQIMGIDQKIVDLVEKFKGQSRQQNNVQQWINEFEPLSESKEFSFYQDDCFTFAMRKGNQFVQIPNNTLAEGDIIQLLPGDIAPALIELIPFDIIDGPGPKKGAKKTVRRNEFYSKQKVYLNKGDQFIVPENCKPDWQKLQVDQQYQDKKIIATYSRGGVGSSPKVKREKSLQSLQKGDSLLKSNMTFGNTKQKSSSQTRKNSISTKFKPQILVSGGKKAQGRKSVAPNRMNPLDLDAKKHQQMDLLDLSKPKQKVSQLDLGSKPTKKKSNFHTYLNDEEHNEVTELEQFNREECNKDLRRQFKKVFIFKVKKTACMGDLQDLVAYNTYLLQEADQTAMADRDKDTLIYYKNRKSLISFFDRVTLASWIVCWVVDLVYYIILSKKNGKFEKFMVHDSHLMLAIMNFFVPMILQISEAWSNSVIHSLFGTLKTQDYNKRFQNSQFDASNPPYVVPNRKQFRMHKVVPKENCCQRLLNFILCRQELNKNTNTSWNQERKDDKQQKREKLKSTTTVRPDSFYEKFDFNNRRLSKFNLKMFWDNLKAGFNPNNNTVANMSSVSIFAFIDKQGITTESHKYVDEIVIINKKGEKEVLDLLHNTMTKREDKIYEFEEKSKYYSNLDQLKGLGLAFMHTRNPKIDENSDQLQEMFVMDEIPIKDDFKVNQPQQVGGESQISGYVLDNSQILDKVQKESGFQFQTVFRQETETHQDCLCSLARNIGHTERSYRQFRCVKQLWNIKRNKEVKRKQEDVRKTAAINRNYAGGNLDLESEQSFKKKERLNNSVKESIDSKHKLDHESISDMKSQDTEQVVENPFVDWRMIRILEKKRQASFCHILTSLIEDYEIPGKYQSFTRGEASVILNECIDYWDGQNIVPISNDMRTEIKQILAQWNVQYETIGFSYKPITDEFNKNVMQDFIRSRLGVDSQIKKANDTLNALNIKSMNNTEFEHQKKKMREAQACQIFLGFVALKHHAKKEVNNLISKLTQAGIRGVVFSKEDIINAKATAQDLGIDTGWNSWVSLDNDPVEKIATIDGKIVLPFGIDDIKDHLKNIDQIPLQVQILCKTNEQRTKEMFQIYQENLEVVGCIGNIMNSANLKSFMKANVAIGMMIEPSYRCQRCNGRITSQQKYSQEVEIGANRDVHFNEPTTIEQLSAALTALACTFVFEADTNIYCIYPALRESRRLRQGIEQAILMSFVCYSTLFLSFFISEIVLGIDGNKFPLLNKYQILVLTILVIPFACFTCLARPWKTQQLIKRNVLNQRLMGQFLDYQIWFIKYSKIQTIITAVFINIIRITNLYLNYCIVDDAKIFSKKSFEVLKTILFKNLLKSDISQEVQQSIFEKIQQTEIHFNLSMILILISFIQIGKESPLSSLFKGFFPQIKILGTLLAKIRWQKQDSNIQKSEIENDFEDENFETEQNTTYNGTFFRAILAQISLSMIYFFSFVVINNGEQVYAHNGSWIAVLVTIILIIGFEEQQKSIVRELHTKDGQKMQIFFSTRLGMWSPR